MTIIEVKNANQLPRWLYLPGPMPLEKAVEKYQQKFGETPTVYKLGVQYFIEMPERAVPQ